MILWVNKRRQCQAYLTVYLALIMTVLLSLCMVLIEGARQGAIRLEAECVTDIGMNSILAEYHRELFSQYNLFAIDSSYGTGYGTKTNTEQHLKQYVERNLSSEDIFLSGFFYKDFLAMSLKDLNMTKVSIYTDEKGAVFRKRAAEAVKDDVGLTLLEDLIQWMETVDSNEFDSRDIAAEKEQVDRQIEDAIDAAEDERTEIDEITGEIIEVHIDFENPTTGLEAKRKEGILKWVTEDAESLSDRKLPVGELVLERMNQGYVNQGNMEIKALTDGEELLERFLFQEYLLRYMGHYGAAEEAGALWYQMEYLVAGRDCDVDNLKVVADRICLVREAANTLYIFSDEIKCMEAELFATAISALIQLPEIIPLLKVSLLLAWAYAESLYDVKIIFAGGRIPLIKTADTWHYSLEGVLQEEAEENDGISEGLSYEDYLRILMMMTNLDTLTGRSMNLVEADIRQTPGNQSFRLDECYDKVEARICVESAYGYTCEITRSKGYEP